MLIQTGIKRVVAPKASSEILERWGEDLELSRIMFREAVVTLDLVDNFEKEAKCEVPG
jgi:deoxycytidylate deaminase